MAYAYSNIERWKDWLNELNDVSTFQNFYIINILQR